MRLLTTGIFQFILLVSAVIFAALINWSELLNRKKDEGMKSYIVHVFMLIILALCKIFVGVIAIFVILFGILIATGGFGWSTYGTPIYRPKVMS
jgi:hypothetical protein